MTYKEQKNLFNHKSITTAIVTQVERQRNSSDKFVRYKFRAREINYTGLIITGILSSDRTEDARHLRRILIGKPFPVLFDSLDPDNNKLLLEKEEYTKFSIKRPDSLRQYFVIIDSIGHVQD